jgi:hypothetical protein
MRKKRISTLMASALGLIAICIISLGAWDIFPEAIAQTNCFGSVPADQWKGEFYNSNNFTGSLLRVSNHGAGFLNYLDNCLPCPTCGLIGIYSARFTRTVNFARGVYRFFLSADAPIRRVYVDGQLLSGTAGVALSAGNHEIKVEYVANGFPHNVSLSWDVVCSATVPAGRWKGEYFNNINLSGAPAMALDDGDGFLNLNFGGGSPGAACGVGVDNFSARWTRTVNFAPGPYRFTAAVDNGVRLYIDGQVKIDEWGEKPPNTYTADVFLSAGNHEIKVEFVEYTINAGINLSWNVNCQAAVPAGRWKGEYFNNADLTGNTVMVGDNGDGFLNLNFGDGSPGAACGLSADNFSARWTRTINFGPGSYRFTVVVDDGARLYIDGLKIIDAWSLQSPTTYTADHTLSAGNHEIKVEYFEAGGGAVISLSWAAAAGVSCLPDAPLIGNAPRTGGGESVATTAISQTNKKCGQRSSE